MHFLVLYILFNCAFLQIARLGQARHAGAIPAAAVNYAVAMVFGVGYFLLRPTGGDAHGWTIAATLGLISGTLFVVHMFILLAAYAAAGVGISVAVTQSGTILPVLVSWYFWQGPMTAARWVAVALVPVALMLMRPNKGAAMRLNWKADLALLASFAAAGAVGVIHKAQVVYVPAMQRGYHMILFTTAAVVIWGVIAARRMRVSRGDWVIGAPWGLINACNLLWVLLALAVMPATQLFPIASTATIAFSLMLSRLFWGERIRPRQAAGVVAAVAVVILANF